MLVGILTGLLQYLKKRTILDQKLGEGKKSIIDPFPTILKIQQPLSSGGGGKAFNGTAIKKITFLRLPKGARKEMYS